MLSQRILEQSARRLAARHPAALARPKLLTPAAATTQSRYASTFHSQAEQHSREDSMQILANQRLHRPVAPHLNIYKPQISWILSMFNRITGIALSGGLYVFGLTYAVAPLVGWKITAAGMAAGFAKWPVILQFLTKFSISMPFTFHSFNGIRHLVWDVGASLNNPMVIKTGWTVVGLTVASSLGLAIFL